MKIIWFQEIKLKDENNRVNQFLLAFCTIQPMCYLGWIHEPQTKIVTFHRFRWYIIWPNSSFPLAFFFFCQVHTSQKRRPACDDGLGISSGKSVGAVLCASQCRFSVCLHIGRWPGSSALPLYWGGWWRPCSNRMAGIWHLGEMPSWLEGRTDLDLKRHWESPGGTFLIEVPSFPMTLASEKLTQDCSAQPLSYLQENCPGEAPPRWSKPSLTQNSRSHKAAMYPFANIQSFEFPNLKTQKARGTVSFFLFN